MRTKDAKKIEALMIEHGWYPARSEGSHVMFKKAGEIKTLSLPLGSKECKMEGPLTKRILREAGIKIKG